MVDLTNPKAVLTQSDSSAFEDSVSYELNRHWMSLKAIEFALHNDVCQRLDAIEAHQRILLDELQWVRAHVSEREKS